MIHDGMKFRHAPSVKFDGAKFWRYVTRRDRYGTHQTAKTIHGDFASTSLMYGDDGRIYLARDGRCYTSKGAK